MATKKPLSSIGAKWRLVPYKWATIPCAFCAGVLGLTKCTDMPDYTLQQRGGVLYGCVDASSLKSDDKCYKLLDNPPEVNRTRTPE
jgi:hypothetical protein